MKALFARSLFVAVLLLLALAAAPVAMAQEGEEEGHGGIDFLGGPDWSSVQDVTIWSIAGVAVFALAMGILYLFKRKVGGFPEHPSWVAPISIMRASDLPADDDSPHEDHVGHDAHGGHAPAH